MTEQRVVPEALVTSENGAGAGSGSIDRHLPPGGIDTVAAAVTEYRRLTYRALVLQAMHTELPPVWQASDDDGIDLFALAAECGCVGPDQHPCHHWDLCLAAALWLDTPDEWAAGVDRAARVEFFAELERVAVGVDAWIASQQPRTQQPGAVA